MSHATQVLSMWQCNKAWTPFHCTQSALQSAWGCSFASHILWQDLISPAASPVGSLCSGRRPPKILASSGKRVFLSTQVVPTPGPKPRKGVMGSTRGQAFGSTHSFAHLFSAYLMRCQYRVVNNSSSDPKPWTESTGNSHTCGIRTETRVSKVRP